MQAELLSVEKRNIWSAEALVAVESKNKPHRYGEMGLAPRRPRTQACM